MTKKSIQLIIILCSTLLNVGCNHYSYNSKYSFYDGAVTTKDEMQNNINVEKFLRYIWIPHNWIRDEEGQLPYFFSFRLDRIENDTISGEFNTGFSLFSTFPSVTYLERLPRKNNMFLEINGNVAKGTFEGDSGFGGNITLKFEEKGIIDVILEYTGSPDKHDYQLQYGEFSLRPLNIITDFEQNEYFVINEDLTFETTLNSWGDVIFFAGFHDGSRHFPAVYLTDTNGNLLYDFRANFATFTYIYEIIIEDRNGDGLLDVAIIADGGEVSYETILATGSSDYRFFHWYFYQLENGWFHLVRGEMP
ncbi:MAG: hypothetical protein FWE02_00830 [Defluviitaleaceae bacterium]|nr:hypothetical protein [Defluviitaleaceae bacterium]